jgi:hypothetical protein
MGMILFLILACGLPGLMLLYVRQRIPEDAWSGLAVKSRMHAAPPKPFERYPGYLGGLKAEGAADQNSDKSLSVHGADIEHGLTSNTMRSDDAEQRSEGVSHTGGALVREQDRKSDLETPPATDPTGIGPPPAGAKISPDGKVTSEISGTAASSDKAKS